MTIAQAAALIAQAIREGRITHEAAAAAQIAIRANSYYGQRLTPRDRESVLRNRFGIA